MSNAHEQDRTTDIQSQLTEIASERDQLRIRLLELDDQESDLLANLTDITLEQREEQRQSEMRVRDALQSSAEAIAKAAQTGDLSALQKLLDKVKYPEPKKPRAVKVEGTKAMPSFDKALALVERWDGLSGAEKEEVVEKIAIALKKIGPLPNDSEYILGELEPLEFAIQKIQQGSLESNDKVYFARVIVTQFRAQEPGPPKSADGSVE